MDAMKEGRNGREGGEKWERGRGEKVSEWVNAGES